MIVGTTGRGGLIIYIWTPADEQGNFAVRVNALYGFGERALRRAINERHFGESVIHRSAFEPNEQLSPDVAHVPIRVLALEGVRECHLCHGRRQRCSAGDLARGELCWRVRRGEPPLTPGGLLKGFSSQVFTTEPAQQIR